MKPKIKKIFRTPNGIKVVAAKPITHTSKDLHIKIILGWKDDGWSTWIYNENEKKEFYGHHYRDNFKIALEDFNTRSWLTGIPHGEQIQKTIKDIRKC